jgi:hypothetical protein
MKQNLIPIALVVAACGGDAFSSSSDEASGTGAAGTDGGLSSGATSGSGASGGGSSSGSGGSSKGGSGGSSTGGHPDGGTTSSGGVEPGGSGGTTSGGTSSGGSSGSGGSGECTPDAVQCVGDQRQTCVGGIWLDNGAACEGACLNGVCVDCEPGAGSCAGAAQPQTCSSSGSWSSGTTCSSAYTMCSSGECVSLGGENCQRMSNFCNDECTSAEACVVCSSGTGPDLGSCRYILDLYNLSSWAYCCAW